MGRLAILDGNVQTSDLTLQGTSEIRVGTIANHFTADLIDCSDKVAAFRGRVAERFGETVAQRMFFQNARDFFVRNETA